MYWLSNPCRGIFGGGALLPEIAPEIVHFNLTRVLQRLGVVEDQDRAGFDLGLGNRALLAVKISRVDNILAVPSVGCGYQGSDPPSCEKPYTVVRVESAAQSTAVVGHMASGTSSAGFPQGQTATLPSTGASSSVDWARS